MTAHPPAAAPTPTPEPPSKPGPRDRLCVAIVTFGGSGLAPVASGTFGSFAALALAYGLHLGGWLDAWVLIGMTLVVSILNVALGTWIERHYGRKDPGQVVLDECAGQWITLLPLYLGDPYPMEAWLAFGIAFLLFRALDITKPLGARKLEALPRGWGILLDDVLCGVYGAGVLFLAKAWLTR